jgi:AcrR family transcriptional regulator
MKPQSLRERLRESTWIAIVDAAESVGASGGSSAMTLQAIAQEAGIAVGTIYNYFSDRSELVDALFSRRREELYRVVEEAAQSQAEASFEVQLDVFVRTVFRFFDERRAFLRLALEATETREPALVKTSSKRRPPTMHLLTMHAERIVELGTREGHLREDAARLFPTSLVSLLKGVLVSRAESEGTLESETDAVVSIFLNGVHK